MYLSDAVMLQVKFEIVVAVLYPGEITSHKSKKFARRKFKCFTGCINGFLQV